MFCALRRVFGGAECVGSRFNVLRSRNRFRRYRGRRVPFSYFARPDSFSAVSGWRRVPFKCVARPNSFSAVPRASGLDFMFCAPRLIFDGTEGVGSRFHVLRSRTNFQWFIRRRVPFHVLRTSSRFRRYQGRLVPFSYFAPRLVFCSTVRVWSCCHVLRSDTHFRWYQRRRFPFSCFARPDSCSTIRRASDPVFQVLRSMTRFRRYRGCPFPFSHFALPDSFSGLGFRVSFSRFALGR
jgi:hypothetical protein